MCGISGIVAYSHSASLIDRNELLATRDAMAARGPDGEGMWVSPDGRAGFAHRRLAIIDLSDRAAQPMSTSDGRLHITFNGEIYNYQALRSELIAKGVQFRTTSDTEVLLHLYRERGAAMVDALRGMYTFAIWDDTEKSLFIARDPFGIKPLYYSDNGDTIRFASQVKALLAGGRIATDPEPAGHVGFFIMGSVPEPYTMYRSIRALKAGFSLTLRRGGRPSVSQFFDVARELAAASVPVNAMTREEMRDQLGGALRDSVAHHMVSDVPVGVFLSSGLDSTTIARLASERQHAELHTITLGFEEYRGTVNDETRLAQATALRIGTRHETHWITRDAFHSEFNALLSAMDQPTIDGVNTYFVSKCAAESGMKVALSGLGGDELFGGYPSFSDVPRLARIFGPMRHLPRLSRALRRIAAPFIGSAVSPKFASLAEFGGTFPGAYLLRRALYMPWELRDFLEPNVFEQGWHDLNLLHELEKAVESVNHPRQAVASLELSWYMRNQLLRDADWAGMAHSLEIRVPFIDVQIFRALASLMMLPNPPSKVDAASTPKVALPSDVLSRRKTGFSIPVHEWANQARIAKGPQRQLRNWAHIVRRPYKKLNSLALVSDAFGGHGGIALYNRDLLTSLCEMAESEEVLALPRLISEPLGELPGRLVYQRDAANSKWRYMISMFRLLRGKRSMDLILCGHINLLSLAVIAKRLLRAPLILFIYGIDAWRPSRSWLSKILLTQVDRIVSISDVTRGRFQTWSRIADDRFVILPNAIHLAWYGPGPKNAHLIARHRLQSKAVLMTLGRLVSSERYKGFDEVLEVLPALVADRPNLVYMIVGDGSDRARLQQKVQELGLVDHVRFTGRISETEKAVYYRLADAFVMPSRGEGFGFVLLEAMACGIPVVASVLDGSREAVRFGQLGILVDPTKRDDVERGIREALLKRERSVPPGLDDFEFANFRKRLATLVRDMLRLPWAKDVHFANSDAASSTARPVSLNMEPPLTGTRGP